MMLLASDFSGMGAFVLVGLCLVVMAMLSYFGSVRGHWSGPVLAGDRLIVISSEGEAFSVSPYTGEPLGREQMAAGGYLGPVIADNSLYVLTDDASLSAYR